MLARRNVTKPLLLLRKSQHIYYEVRFASNGPPKKTLRSKVEAGKPAYRKPPLRPAHPQSHLDPESKQAPAPPFSPLTTRRLPKLPGKFAIYLFGGVAVFAGFYAFTVIKSISNESAQSRELGDTVDPNAPSVKTYDHIAPYFDKQVDFTELLQGITRLRKQVVGEASGDVLEIGCGTGRNFDGYKLKGCRSITFSDAAENMIAIASTKWNQRRLLPEWRETAPDGTRRVNFKILSASDDVAPPVLVGEKGGTGFTTIISTFTLCSMPHPEQALAHMCSLLAKRQPGSQEEPRVLLLEHGKSEYKWLNNLLNNSAPAHAHQYGCWWNRDIGAIAAQAAAQAGMDLVDMRRKHFGTTWIIEMRPKPDRHTNVSATTAEDASTIKESVPAKSNSGRGTGDGKWWQVW